VYHYLQICVSVTNKKKYIKKKTNQFFIIQIVLILGKGLFGAFIIKRFGGTASTN